MTWDRPGDTRKGIAARDTHKPIAIRGEDG